MSTTIEPTIGRIVYYRGLDGVTRPAIIVGVNGTFNLDLYVFGQDSDDDTSGHMGHVTHADPEQEPTCFPSWHWMPYQKQQAEKQAGEQHIGLIGAALRQTNDASLAAGRDFDAESRRAHALQAALQTTHPSGRDAADVLAAAKVYEDYLRGQ